MWRTPVAQKSNEKNIKSTLSFVSVGEKWSFATLNPLQTGSVMPNFVCHNSRLGTVVPLA